MTHEPRKPPMSPQELAKTPEERAKVKALKAKFNATMVGRGTPVLIEFLDEAVDSLRRRRFSLRWIGSDHIRNGMVRGQHFFADPSAHVVMDGQ